MDYEANIAYVAAKYVTPEDWDKGNAWYEEANSYAKVLSYTFKVPMGIAAAVIAVLSPRVTWEGNKVAAYTAFAGYGKRPGITGNYLKAARIIADRDLTSLSGPKVNAFYRNILGCKQTVTVDSWAFRIAINDPKHDGRVKPKEQTAVKAAYVKVANDLGVFPATLQAATWVAYRREHARANNDTAWAA